MTPCGEHDAANCRHDNGVCHGFAGNVPLEFAPARAPVTRQSKREEAMLHFGRGRTRRGLASAFIGEIAAVIDGMEGFEEVRKLEDMELGAEEHLDELGAFTLPKFSIYESYAGRLDLFDAAIQRQIVYFFTRAGILAGHLHALASTSKEAKALCKQHAIDAQKEINGLLELGDDLLRDLRKLVSKKQPATISRA
jgi:hypothetical protein